MWWSAYKHGPKFEPNGIFPILVNDSHQDGPETCLLLLGFIKAEPGKYVPVGAKIPKAQLQWFIYGQFMQMAIFVAYLDVLKEYFRI